VLDDRVRAVLARLEEEDEREGTAGTPYSERSLAVGPESGQLLFALVAANAGCEVLEIGGSRGYSTIWLAAAARILGGRVVSLEQDPRKTEAWRQNIAEAGLDEWAELVEGDALATLERLEEGFDVVFIDAWKDDYERIFALARQKVRRLCIDSVYRGKEVVGCQIRAVPAAEVPAGRGVSPGPTGESP
jgi:predicted O-methyltransferase YrrM